MTAKEDLNRIRHIDKLLKATEKEIARLRSDIYSLHATDYSKDVVSGGQPTDISDKVVTLKYKLDLANKYWDELIDTREEIRRRIDNIPDLLLRAVLVEYYILQQTWEEVSVAVGYCWKQTHRKHAEALKVYAKVNKDVLE